MNEIEYEFGEIKEYEKKIWQLGICDGLAKVSFIGSKAIIECSGHTNIAEYIKNSPQNTVTSRACRIISALRKIIESKLLADDYLIAENSISLDIENLWFFPVDGKIKLFPQKSEGEFFDRLCFLCTQLGSDNIKERLIGENSKCKMSEKDLLKFLSSFELELRQ